MGWSVAVDGGSGRKRGGRATGGREDDKRKESGERVEERVEKRVEKKSVGERGEETAG